MRLGINEALLYERSSGARQRELILVPELLQQLTAKGHKGIVYLPRGLDVKYKTILAGENRDVTFRDTPVPALPTYARVIRGSLYFRRQIQNDGIDIFQTNYYPIPHVRVPTVLTVHDLRFVHFPETYTKGRLAFLRRVVPLSLQNADRIVAISNDTKRALVELFHVASTKVDVIPNPISPSWARVTDQALLQEVAAKYSLPSRFVLFVGHLEPRKNLVRLLGAYALYAKQVHDAYDLVILGKESFGVEPIHEEARRSGIAEKIRFTGYVDEEDFAAAFSLASILAFPSLHEGFGIPVIEAMACGIPVLTSNTSALPEVTGDAGILVDPTNIQEIASGLIMLHSSEELRQTLISKGYVRVRDFSVDRIAASMIDVCERTLAMGKRSNRNL